MSWLHSHLHRHIGGTNFNFSSCLALIVTILKAMSLLGFWVNICTTDKQIKVLALKVFSVGAAQPPLPKLGMLSTSEC